MDTPNHRALVVEDDAPTREELVEILRSLGLDGVGCGDKQTALRYIREQPFCIALIDLQIFGDPEAIKPHEVHGRTLVREIRTIYPDRNGVNHGFPIVVVSGYAREGAEAKEVMREGASDIVWKLPTGGLSGELSRAIREALRASGREDHASCANAPSPAIVRKSDYELSIPAIRNGRRVEVQLGVRSATLPNRLLRVLLHLVRGHLTGQPVHKSNMGDASDRGFKLASDLDREMRTAFPPGVTAITKNHYHGNYSLIEQVTIGTVAIEQLVALDDHVICGLARQIAELRSKSDGKS
jgi:CheY-like chemotaxis protein